MHSLLSVSELGLVPESSSCEPGNHYAECVAYSKERITVTY